MPGVEPTGFILLQEDLSIISLFFNNFRFEIILLSSLMMSLIPLPAGKSCLENLALSLRIYSITFI